MFDFLGLADGGKEYALSQVSSREAMVSAAMKGVNYT
jgi:hypothetical protein